MKYKKVIRNRDKGIPADSLSLLFRVFDGHYVQNFNNNLNDYARVGVFNKKQTAFFDVLSGEEINVYVHLDAYDKLVSDGKNKFVSADLKMGEYDSKIVDKNARTTYSRFVDVNSDLFSQFYTAQTNGEVVTKDLLFDVVDELNSKITEQLGVYASKFDNQQMTNSTTNTLSKPTTHKATKVVEKDIEKQS